MHPPLPLIAIADIFVSLIDENYPLDKATVFDVLNRSADETEYFDSQGNVWKSTMYSDACKDNIVTRFLAKTFYNPTVTIHRDWEKRRHYSIGELKTHLYNCINRDDDILTQFVEADTLKEKLGACHEFACIVDILGRYIFNPNEEDIDKELPDEAQLNS